MNTEKQALIDRQMDGIFALEGCPLTDDMRKIRQAVDHGRVDSRQVYNEMLEYIKRHKTFEGFILSRAWVDL